MAQVINTNITSLNSQRHLNQTNSALSKAMERLSSGKRINSAKDDAAGLGISARMTTQVNGMNQAIRNANDGISLTQTAEGALATSEEMLQRIRTLAVQASTATNASIDRQAIQEEINQLVSGLDEIASQTSFNGQKLLDGTIGEQQVQVGASAGETVSIGEINFKVDAYGNNRLEGVAISPGTKVGAGQFIVSGAAGSATISVKEDALAKDVAAAINAQTDKTGVAATATTQVNLGNLQASNSYVFDVKSNNKEAITVSFTIGADGNLSEAVKVFNEQVAKTGVRAQVDATTGGIKLVNNAGETIALQAKNDVAKATTMASYDAKGNLSAKQEVTDNAYVEAVGTVSMDSLESFVVTEVIPTAGLNLVGNSQLNSVGSISVATFEDAQKAIATIDSAISAVSNERSKYAAIQNRFESTVTNLMGNSENTSASKSRIEDANYAQEITNQSRSLLLQKMGVAMQTHVNQLPQMVLSLLK